MATWKVTAFGSKEVIETALARHSEALDWDPEIVVSGFEIADDRPDEWRLDAYLSRKPTATDWASIRGLFEGTSPRFASKQLEDEDWVTLSQQGVQPIRAGRFYVRTPDYPADTTPAVIDFEIPASQAFGTGQHETTAGCLAMLDTMKQRGVVVRNHIDVGTGTGLLAFAAMRLWPGATATASDIDPVCLEVIEFNAAQNAITLGARGGELTIAIADGIQHPLLQARGPYDLLIANILAAPLIELAPNFADAVLPKGGIVLTGLLETQESDVRRAYVKAGFRLAGRIVNGDWSILWLRRRGIR